MNRQVTIQTPFGHVTAEWSDRVLSSIRLGAYVGSGSDVIVVSGDPPKGGEPVVAGLIAHFQGETNGLPAPSFLPDGSPFQQAVWRSTLDVPFGETVSYGQIAERVGRQAGASRAVGMALNRNPLPLIIPCHRVVSSTGELMGFAAGLSWKRALLGLEVSQISLAL